MDRKMLVGFEKMRLMMTQADRTTFGQELADAMVNFYNLQKVDIKLIDRIRFAAQVNKFHRTYDRLVPLEDESNERLQLANVCKELAAECAKSNERVAGYFNKLADTQQQVAKLQDTFWRQVQRYCVNELKKLVDEEYPQIKAEYGKLEQTRDLYDAARDRLKRCNQQSIEKYGILAKERQKEFELQAFKLDALLQRLPKVVYQLMRALNAHVRAETKLWRCVRTTYHQLR